MIRFIICALALLIVSGCTCTQPCTTDAQCGDGVCFKDETGNSFCITKVTGDSGQPTDAGSDAGIDAGFDAGPRDAGTRDAGPQPLCSRACEAWELCIQTSDGGVCEEVTLSFITPMSGDVFDAGATLQLSLVATLPDSSMPSISVPLSSNVPGAPTSVTAGGPPAQIQLPSTTAQYTFTAGWGPSHSKSVNVFTRACSLTCAPFEECVATVTGGACITADIDLAWQLPAENTKLNSGQTIGAVIGITKRDGGIPLVARLPVQNSTEPFTCSAGTCVGTVGNFSAPDGPRLVFAGWDGGPLAARSFTLDTTGPALGIIVQSGNRNEVMRDEVVSMILTSNEALADSGVTFAGAPVAPVPSVNCPGYGSTSNAVACFKLDFSQPLLNAMDGGFITAASAVDSVGNSGSASPVTTLVTRERWTKSVAPSDQYTTQAIAIGPDGDIYVGYRLTAATGAIARVRAIDGLTTFSSPDAGAVMSLSLANGILFYAANKPNGVIGGIDLPAMEPNPSSTCGPIPSAPTYSGIALRRNGASGVGALGILNASPTALCEYRPGSSTNSLDISSGDSAVVPNELLTSANIIISGPNASILSGSDTLNSTYWVPIHDLDLPMRRLGRAQPLTTPSPTESPPVFGQALMPVGQTGPFLIGASASLLGSPLYASDPSLDGGMAGGNLGAVADTGTPAVASAAEAYVGRSSQLVRFNPSSLNLAASRLYPLGSALRTSPVLGSPRAVGGQTLGYAVSSGGRLLAFGTGASTAEWVSELGLTIHAHPTLDCNRAAPNSKTGILYVGSNNGTLKAIIVDSPGLLDSPGAWPKFQRSAGNAGNDDTSNFPTNWPCP